MKQDWDAIAYLSVTPYGMTHHQETVRLPR